MEAGKFTFGRLRIGDLERIAPVIRDGINSYKAIPMPDGYCAMWGIIAMHHTFDLEPFMKLTRGLIGLTRGVTIGELVAAIGSYIPMYTSLTSSPVPYLFLWQNHCYYVFGNKSSSLLD